MILKYLSLGKGHYKDTKLAIKNEVEDKNAWILLQKEVGVWQDWIRSNNMGVPPDDMY